MAEEKKKEEAREKKAEKAQVEEKKKATERSEEVPARGRSEGAPQRSDQRKSPGGDEASPKGDDSGSGKEAKPKAEQSKKSDIELTGKMKDIISSIEGMTVLELSGLVKALEDKFGVTAAQSVVAAGVAGAAAPGAAAAEEKTAFTVVLASAGSNKIHVIKEIRAITTLGLKEAKDLVESAPKTVKEGVAKEEAEDIKKKLEAVGGKVEVK